MLYFTQENGSVSYIHYTLYYFMKTCMNKVTMFHLFEGRQIYLLKLVYHNKTFISKYIYIIYTR